MKINIYITQNFLFKFKKILFLLNNNVQLLSDLGLKELCSEIEIEKIHKDWKEYILKLENTIDKEYFKPYWLPIVKVETIFKVCEPQTFGFYKKQLK